jgi:hypothetical protein
MASESSKAVPGEERRRGRGWGRRGRRLRQLGLYTAYAPFSAHPMWVSVGFGVAATPWRAVQIAGRAAAGREAPE